MRKETDFFEEALQKRFEQMEQYQEKGEELEVQVKELQAKLAEKEAAVRDLASTRGDTAKLTEQVKTL
jgi:chromosome segregation ATPase